MIPDPLLGRVVDSRYEIVQRVARGGMATVYLARDRRLDRDVALKLMHAHLADSPDFVARFRREARAAARLSHPGVVAVYDQGSVDGVAYLVMELVNGPNLRELIAGAPLSVGRALDLTEQILRPLGAAHRSGLVHRDIKPENVLLPADGSAAKVADFGLARAVTEATQTTSGNILGTVAYLAPELLTHGTSSARADVYAVGVVLYEMLTGAQPFSGDSPVQIAFRAVHEDVPAASVRVPGLSPLVSDFVSQLTRRDPLGRPEDADAALELLRELRPRLSQAELACQRPDPQPDRDHGAGTRTVSLPVGSLGPRSATVPVPGQSGSGSASTAPTPVVGSGDTEAHRRPRRSRRAVLALGALALAGGGAGAGWYFGLGPGRQVTVPQVVGASESDAEATLRAHELAWGSPSREYSDTVPEGAVISTSPAAGESVRVGSAVVAVVSRGIEHRAVPDLAGMDPDAAAQALSDAGLSVGATSEEYSDSVPAGQVISSDPAAGTSIPHTQTVAIVVSKGREPITVPDVRGMTRQQAEAALSSAGAGVGAVSEEYSDTVEAGLVVSTSPAAGASDVFKGDAVALVVSKGPEMVVVPDVVSLSEAQAKKALEAVGLTVTVNRVLGGFFGTARSTDPAAGTSVRKGSTVTLNVV